MGGFWLMLAVVVAGVPAAVGYTVQELKSADHSIGMKLAVEEDDVEVLRGLLHEYLSVQKVDPAELWTARTNIFKYADYPVVHYACLLDDRGAHLRVLLEAGGPADAESDSGVKPLHVAAQENSVDALRVLLEAGVDPRPPATERVVRNNDARQVGYDGMTAATMAAKAGHVNVLRAMRDFGGHAAASLQERDSNPDKDEGGWAPIQYAAHKGHHSVVDFLTFEVGWGSLRTAEVVEAAKDTYRKEIERLGRLEGPDFQAARDRYLAERARRASAEL